MYDLSAINKVVARQLEDIRTKCEEIKPLVVIRSLAYNHENYIRDALDGFVCQKTTFPFVVIIHDDASTDNTAQIIREYAEIYPDIILPIFEKENQYSKRDGSLGNIVNTASKYTGAKYIALCEGDDYWTDKFKLQKQIDFLENHPDYSMCFHKILSIGGDSKENDNIFDGVESKEYFARDLLNKWIVQTASLVIRWDIYIKKPVHNDFYIGDNVVLATCIANGRIYGFQDAMGVYRRTTDGWTLKSRKNKEQIYETNKKLIKHYKRLNLFFPSLKHYYDKRIMRSMNENIVICLKFGKKKEALEIVSEGIKEYGLQYIVSSFAYVVKAIRHKLTKN